MHLFTNTGEFSKVIGSQKAAHKPSNNEMLLVFPLQPRNGCHCVEIALVVDARQRCQHQEQLKHSAYHVLWEFDVKRRYENEIDTFRVEVHADQTV